MSDTPVMYIFDSLQPCNIQVTNQYGASADQWRLVRLQRAVSTVVLVLHL